jgi:hypothetical protein
MKAKPTDKHTKQIEQLLVKTYGAKHPAATIRVYRYNPVSIRVRIVDPDFEGKMIHERESEVWTILKKLPKQVFLDISVLLLITPEEKGGSIMSHEFEDPLPSGF